MPKKRKSRNSSGNESEQVNKSKNLKTRGPSGDQGISVSEILSETNAVLYKTEDTIVSAADSEVFLESSSTVQNLSKLLTMASVPNSSNIPGVQDPTNKDIFDFLKKIDSRLISVEKRLDSLKEVEKKVDSVEKDLKRLWVAVEDRNKIFDERITKLEEKSESLDFGLSMINSKVIQLEKEKESLQENLTYLQSQSMRNNLLFGNIPEVSDDQTEDTEKTLRTFISEKMKLASDVVEKLSFERVHRMGSRVEGGRPRQIVAKFTLFKEKELIRRQWKVLEAPYYVSEQFPKDVIEKRKKLLPKMKDARKAGKKAWLAYDTLYVDGKPVKD